MKPHLRITVETLLRTGTSQREIARRTGVDRKTIRGYPDFRYSPSAPPIFVWGRRRNPLLTLAASSWSVVISRCSGDLGA